MANHDFVFEESGKRSSIALPIRMLLNDQYRIGRVLGIGGFGVTYLALDIKLERVVAIKEYMPRDLASRENSTTIRPHSESDAEYFRYGLEQFLQEARTLAKFDEHSNIVRVTNFFEAHGTGYLVMNYYEGQTLAGFLKAKGGKLSQDQALNIMYPALDGLRGVHQKRILHRDIDPNNIYLTNTGKVVLLDFGAARVAMGERSKSLSVILKPGYAPYEQYHSKGTQGPWTDIYAAAATLYRLLTGKIPPESVGRVLKDKIRTPAQYNPDIEPWLSDAIMKGLSVRAEDRPSHIYAFQQLLRDTDAEPPGPAEQAVINEWRAMLVDKTDDDRKSGGTKDADQTDDKTADKKGGGAINDGKKGDDDQTIAVNQKPEKKKGGLAKILVPVVVLLVAAGAYAFWPDGGPIAGDDCVAVQSADLILSGPSQVAAGEDAIFAVQPGSQATQPYAYAWDPYGGVAGELALFVDDPQANTRTFTWDEPGTYTMTAKVRNCDDVVATTSQNVTVTPASIAGATEDPAPTQPGSIACTAADVGRIDFSDPTPEPGQSIRVSAPGASGDAPITWAWDFGDGATASAAQAQHAFANAGTYTVRVTAENCGGPSTNTRAITVAAATPQTPADLATAGQQAFSGRRYQEAIRLFTQALDQEPNLHAARELRGIAYQLTGNYSAGIADYDYLVANDGQKPGYLGNRGYLHLGANQLDMALTDFRSAVALDRTSVDATVGLAIVYARLNNDNLAQTYYREAINLNAAFGESLSAIQQQGFIYDSDQRAIIERLIQQTQ